MDGAMSDLEEWEVIPTPSQDEWETFDYSNPELADYPRYSTPPPKDNDTAAGILQQDSNGKEVPKVGDSQLARAKFTERSPHAELQPCMSCSSYHYIPSCIYLLSWTEWLEYYSTYMPSQPWPLASEAVPMEDFEHESLLARARQLDDLPDNARPNYISNTLLKADLMTKSLAGMYYEDEEWELRLRRRSKTQCVERSFATQNLEAQQRLAWLEDMGELESDGEENDGEENEVKEGDVQADSALLREWDDEVDALSRLRSDLGRKLPRTSTTALFNPRD